MLNKLLSSSMLTMDIFEDIGNAVQSMWYKIMLTIDAIVFYTLDLCYQVFLALSRARIFEDNFFEGFIRRFYVLVGVLMLFFVVYTLLKVIVNPDDMTKGNMAPGKIITNVLTSIVLVALLPTIFNLLYRVQGVLLDNDIVGRIVIGGNSADEIQDSVKKGGREIAVQVFTAFFYPNDGYTEETIIADSGHQLSFAEAKRRFINEEATFWIFCDFSHNAAEDQVHYSYIMSTIAGGFCLYVMLCFVFDVGIRAVKLGVLQVIAPIPILMRVLPNKDKTFSSWLSLTLSTFFELFVRIFIVYIIAVLAGQMGTIFDNMGDSFTNLAGPVAALAKAFLLMGIIAFAKQAPKMLSDLLGIKSGNMGLSLSQRMTAGGGWMMAGAVGGLASTATRNAIQRGTNTWRGLKQLPNTFKDPNISKKEKAAAVGNSVKSVGKTALSTFAGGVSGGLRGAYENRNSKSFADLKRATTKATNDAVDARNKREKYPMFDYKKDKDGNYVYDEHGNKQKVFTGGYAAQRLKDAGLAISTWATGNTVESLQKKQKVYGDAASKIGSVNSELESEVNKKDSSTAALIKYKTTDENGNVVERFAYNIKRDQSGNLHIVTIGDLKKIESEYNAQLTSLSINDFEASDSLKLEREKLVSDLNSLDPGSDTFASDKAKIEASINDVDVKIRSEKETQLKKEQERLRIEIDKAHKDVDDAVKAAVASQYNAEKYNDITQAVIYKNIQEDLQINPTDEIKDINGNVVSYGVNIAHPENVNRVTGLTSKIKDFESLVSSNVVAMNNDAQAEWDMLEKLLKEEFKRPSKDGGPREMVIKDLNDRFENLKRLMAYYADQNAKSFNFKKYSIGSLKADGTYEIKIEDSIGEISPKKLAGSFNDQENSIKDAMLELKKKEEASGKKDK